MPVINLTDHELWTIVRIMQSHLDNGWRDAYPHGHTARLFERLSAEHMIACRDAGRRAGLNRTVDATIDALLAECTIPIGKPTPKTPKE